MKLKKNLKIKRKSILENKKAQLIDMEILGSLAFIILAGMAISATVLGYVMGQNMGWGQFPVWQLIVIILVEILAAYVIVAKNQ